MKAIVTIFFLCLYTLAFSQISEVREAYEKASDNEELTKSLHNKLESVSAKGEATLQVYKGAVMTMMAKYTKDRKEKKDFFKRGAMLIEDLILNNPKNIEARYVRLSVQENAPKFLGYHKNREEDKAFILDNFKAINNVSLKSTIRKYIENSQLFTPEEQELLD